MRKFNKGIIFYLLVRNSRLSQFHFILTLPVFILLSCLWKVALSIKLQKCTFFSQMNIGDVCECIFPGAESESECLSASAIGLFGSRPGYAAVAAETVFTR